MNERATKAESQAASLLAEVERLRKVSLYLVFGLSVALLQVQSHSFVGLIETSFAGERVVDGATAPLRTQERGRVVSHY